MTLAPSQIKACCAATYSGPVARFLLGDTFHPGGSALSSRLLAALQVDAAATVLDLASGPGTSAILAARQLGCTVVGVELSAENVAAAGDAARRAGVAARVRFVQGDAESLPLGDASIDGALCECAFCLFPDKTTAAAELARVLTPGARLALSDVTADPERLPAELSGISAWAACVADARPLDEIAALLEQAGLVVEHSERQDRLVKDVVARVEARLRLARLLDPGLARDLGPGIERGLALIPTVREAIDRGALGYGIVVARR
ncbi:Methyltransferase domain-containing protein [Gaiella occulta]|uniref:Methyltransferase domain-containing protein n=1 Tax=Gaiella occulta TaxID=1002870 RepID=A0A7M2YX35_9ACTN|nr:methyltransferase domain-containing protein [Gaiella occulta]RDI74028.1 Methyltransferase domain-containing protein [Gaiella occulta]